MSLLELTTHAPGSPLPPDDAAGVTDLIAAARDHDGVPPLDEVAQFVVAGSRPARQVVARRKSRVVGYGQFQTDATPGQVVVVVAPDARRQGVGTALVQAALADVTGVFVAWAHGELPGSAEFATSLGGLPVRTLWRMAWEVPTQAAAQLPDTELASARPGFDLADVAPADVLGLVSVNAAAFAQHPEQGGWSLADFQERMADKDFQPSQLLVAHHVATGAVAGFHWVKVTRSGSGELVGEVYVVGVAPRWQGHGLGRWLVRAGMDRLISFGVHSISLYVEADNAAAVGLYESLGFAVVERHVMYRGDRVSRESVAGVE